MQIHKMFYVLIGSYARGLQSNNNQYSAKKKQIHI